MATLTIRNLNEQLKSRLRIRAATRGRSMEEEARQILQAALVAPETETPSLVNSIRRRFAELGDVRLPIAARESVHRFELPNDLRQSVTTAAGKPVVQKLKRGT